MVDVHILILPTTNVYWLEKCLGSLEGEPVRIHVTKGIEGNIAEARTTAFQLGNEKYVSFVDHDDEVISGTFQKLINILEEDENIVMAYSDEILVDATGKKICDGWSTDHKRFDKYDLSPHLVNGHYIHHLRVMRRDAVTKCLPLKTKMIPEPCLMYDLSLLGDFAHLKEPGYKWRIHGENEFLKYTQEHFQEVMAWR